MARFKGRPKGRGPKKKRARYREQSKCRFCRDKVKDIDFKEVAILQKLTTEQGKQFSRKRSGNCAKHQRWSQRAIKHARFMALLPYSG